mgnify:CR=1 FL=1
MAIDETAIPLRQEVRGAGVVGEQPHLLDLSLEDLLDPAAACYRNAERLDRESFLWPYYLGAVYQAEGDLDVTSVATLLAGGRSGPSVVPGEPEKSLLLRFLPVIRTFRRLRAGSKRRHLDDFVPEDDMDQAKTTPNDA